jgi:hypothetical protein
MTNKQGSTNYRATKEALNRAEPFSVDQTAPDAVGSKDPEYILCISKPLTYDQLGDMYQKATGNSARTKPLDFVREWAEKRTVWFYVCPIEGTIHKKGYAKPLPVSA